ncbi:MAG: M3 family oligoendopeptidase [Bacteroidota bacterium]|jgi:oligoendopeptidase F
MTHTNSAFSIPEKPQRHYLPAVIKDFQWQDVEPYFTELTNRPIQSAAELRQWLLDRSELESFLQEDVAWRYIRMSCDTASQPYKEAFEFFVTEIEPNVAPYNDQLNRKLLDCEHVSALHDARMEIMLRGIRKQVEIFREENIPLFTELQKKEQEFSTISGAMTVVVDGQELTLQQASNLLKSQDPEVRKQVFGKIAARRLQDKESLDKLFDELIELRHQIACNAGFDNYRDYMFAAMGRFDYSVADCERFHDAIAQEVVPLLNELHLKRKQALNTDCLHPWDTSVSTSGRSAPIPFRGGDDMMEKTISCFKKIHPVASQSMELLRDLKQVDLDSRKGKAPGGYNYPLYETGVPFIFMNSADSVLDLTTMVHEGGHAIHSVLTRDLDYVPFRNIPSEIAELASMSMELVSMEHWDSFFSDTKDLTEARKEQLEQIIVALPWIAAIDQFQHWIYTHPGHNATERREEWHRINKLFSSSVVDYTGFEEVFDNQWQKQIHLFQYPFYYIEYGIAQLGALAVWRNYVSSPEKSVAQYLNALKLGYSADMATVYETAGIKFDFSQSYVRELATFLMSRLDKLD